MEEVLQPDAFNILQNNGKFAGQEVAHYHMHIVPRYHGRGERGVCESIHPKNYEYKPSTQELTSIAKKLTLG